MKKMTTGPTDPEGPLILSHLCFRNGCRPEEVEQTRWTKPAISAGETENGNADESVCSFRGDGHARG